MRLVEWLKQNKKMLDQRRLVFKNNGLNKTLYPIFSQNIDEFSECKNNFTFTDKVKIEYKGKMRHTQIHAVNDNYKIPNGSIIYSITLSLPMLDENSNIVHNAMVRSFHPSQKDN